ncbi:MAG: hypothetical protein JWO31_317, partial [Phycisphaerales bacterium]|nr:hypothetical protein [Phycisphaerales bacterium]
AERLYAAEALHRLTGQTHDYHYYDVEPKRAEAVARWRAWLAAQPPAVAAAGPGEKSR